MGSPTWDTAFILDTQCTLLLSTQSMLRRSIMSSMPPLLCTLPLPTLLLSSRSSRRPLNPTPTPTVLPTTTPSPTSTPRSLVMPTVLSVALSPSPFPTAGSRLSLTPPTTPTATSPTLSTPERRSTPLPRLVATSERTTPMLLPLPLPITPKTSLCFVNIYGVFIENTQKNPRKK